MTERRGCDPRSQALGGQRNTRGKVVKDNQGIHDTDWGVRPVGWLK